jgi:hypothetical protein
MPYKVIPLDFGVAGDAVRLVDPGTVIVDVNVRRLSDGASLSIAFGSQANVPVDLGDVWSCCGEKAGLFASWPKQAGLSAMLVVNVEGS